MSRGCPNVDTSCYHIDGADCIILSDIRESRDLVCTIPLKQGKVSS